MALVTAPCCLLLRPFLELAFALRVLLTPYLVAGIVHHDIGRLPGTLHEAFLQPDGTLADGLDRVQIMRDQQQCAAAITKLLDGTHALVLKVLVAYSQDLVHQQEVRFGVNGHGKAKAYVHA